MGAGTWCLVFPRLETAKYATRLFRVSPGERGAEHLSEAVLARVDAAQADSPLRLGTGSYQDNRLGTMRHVLASVALELGERAPGGTG